MENWGSASPNCQKIHHCYTTGEELCGVWKLWEKSNILKSFKPFLRNHLQEGFRSIKNYWPEQFRSIRIYWPEQFRSIRNYWPERFRSIRNYWPEGFRSITSSINKRKISWILGWIVSEQKEYGKEEYRPCTYTIHHTHYFAQYHHHHHLLHPHQCRHGWQFIFL